MSEDSDALIREIDEEVRRERLKRLWDKYGVLFIAAVLGAVVLVGGWQWYVAYQADRAATSGSQFQQALEMLDSEEKSDGLTALEQVIKEGTPAYSTLARLRLAAAHRDAGKLDEAAAVYEEVANDTSADELLRSFARLQAGALKVDTGSWTDVENHLRPLAAEDGPWRLTALELLGVAAFRHKQWQAAQDAYASLLAQATATPAVRQRAQAAMTLITRELAAQENAESGAAPSTQPAEKSEGVQKSNAAGTTEPNASSPAKSGGDAATSTPSTSGTDLKNDKSADEDGPSTAEGNGAAKPAATPAKGAGANNDASPKN